MKLYIPPDSEDYTGYTIFVSSASSTSELQSFYYPFEEEDNRNDERIFPQTHEEEFLDDDLAEFYRKKGY